MNKENSLEEDVHHGTADRPIAALHFAAGEGTVYPNGFFVERHWHHSIEILKVLKGSYTVELNLENHTLETGDICMINSGELHQIEGNEKTGRHDVIIFNPHILQFSYHDEFQDTLVEPLLSHQYSLPHIIHPQSRGHAALSALFDQVVSLQDTKQEDWYFSCKLLMLDMLNQFKKNELLIPSASIQTETEKEKIDRYKRIVSYIQEHFMDKVTLEQLAEVARCNSQYLCHFFKDIAEVSPIQYLIAYRIERAQDMLKDSTKTVLEISLDCGFENVSYFIRQFKRAVGETPRQYRVK